VERVVIIGIAGKKCVGKSTAADLLVAQGFERASFAGPLKEMAASLLRNLGMNETEINAASVDKEAMLPRLGVSYRVMLQTLGTDWGRALNPDMWLLCAESKMPAQDAMHVVFDDLRFDNEAHLIRAKGGLIIHLSRETGLTDSHASEAGIGVHDGDAVIVNNGSFESLEYEIGKSIGLFMRKRSEVVL
jgi:hypothetical protein